MTASSIICRGLTNTHSRQLTGLSVLRWPPPAGSLLFFLSWHVSHFYLWIMYEVFFIHFYIHLAPTLGLFGLAVRSAGAPTHYRSLSKLRFFSLLQNWQVQFAERRFISYSRPYDFLQAARLSVTVLQQEFPNLKLEALSLVSIAIASEPTM